MKQLIDEIIDLRNSIHKEDFRFVLTPDHWKALYVPENSEQSNLATVRDNGKLKGYAAFYLVNFDQVKAYDVREIVAEDQNTLERLLSQISDKGVKDNVDFVFLKRCEELYNHVFAKKGFASFIESVIMIAMFDPSQLFSAISGQVKKGKVLRLMIKGFNPLTIKVGEKEVMLTDNEKPTITISTDHRTFTRLLFGRTSLKKEYLRGTVKISSVFSFVAASKFFAIIRQPTWYIPMGDWV